MYLRRSKPGKPTFPYHSSVVLHGTRIKFSLLRKRPMTSPKNVILFGETGAGKSAVINLISGAEIASTSRNMKACTLQATRYNFGTLTGKPHDLGMSVDIWDTVGLEEPDGDVLRAIKSAHTLITDLHAAGGVDLLLFCIRGGRITVAMQRHYRLFFEVLCAERVPLAIVVTHLENEKRMEDWWVRNQGVLAEYGMCSVAHVCITAAPKHLRMYTSKRTISGRVLNRMLRGTLSELRQPYVREKDSWLMSVVEVVLEFLVRKVPFLGWFKKQALVKQLETRCAFRQEEAQRVADMMLTPRKG